MDAERTFIIGDIHGCLDLLNRLVEKLKWNPQKDQLIFLGDYIDRGQDSKGVIDYILALRCCSTNVHCLMGNHEALFLAYLTGRQHELFYANGGLTTLESYYRCNLDWGDDLIPPKHMEFFKSLLTFLELPDYYVVHAGFRPGVRLEDQSLEDLLWIRDSFIYEPCALGKSVIFGHTPFYEPLVMEDKIGLDTGAVYGNKLTCMELPEMRFHSVSSSHRAIPFR
jgi:serine/threonine protein phosphatase 1